MHIISKTTMKAKPLCGWSRNPMEGVTAIHINKRNLKFEKDQIVIFHTWKIVQHQKRIPILQVNLENLIPRRQKVKNKITMNQSWNQPTDKTNKTAI